MKRRFAFCCLVFVSAFVRADGDIDPDYYRSTILSRGQGVYEEGGVLYVHSTAPYDVRSSSAAKTNKTARAKALLGVDALLKAWAVSNTAPQRVQAVQFPPGVDYARQVLDALDPDWRFASWKVSSLPARQMYNAAEGGRYVCAFAIRKDVLLAALPEAFRRPCTEKDVLDELPRRIGTGLRDARQGKVLARCGACDLSGTSCVANGVADEFAKVNDRLADYWRQSAFGKSLRDEIARLSTPQVETNHSVVANPQGTLRTEKLEVTIVTRNPRFQKLFLEPGETNAPLPRVESGARAVAAAFDAKRSVGEQCSALRSALEENPGDKELWNLYGRVLIKSGEPWAAVSCFRNALKLDARYVFPIVNLAKTYKELGFSRLAWGLAMVARSMKTDDWSRRESESLLRGGAPVEVTKPAAEAKPAEVAKPAEETKPAKGKNARFLNVEVNVDGL